MNINLTENEKKEVEIITLGVKCKKCGHTWGVRLDKQKSLDNLSPLLFVCETCLKNNNN
jgi:hypothetical protein